MPQIAIEFKASSFITFSCLEEQYLQCAEAFKSEGIFQLMKESTQKKMVQEPNFWFLGSVNRRFILKTFFNFVCVQKVFIFWSLKFCHYFILQTRRL